MTDRAKNAELISRNIKRLRGIAEWSQADLARASGVSPAAISLIENGDRIPSLAVTRKLASAFNVSEAEIIGTEQSLPKEFNSRAQAFFRNYGAIENLDPADQKMIKELIERPKGRDNDKRKG